MPEIDGTKISVKFCLWDVLNEHGEAGEDWRYVKRAVKKSLKDLNPAFMKQLNNEILSIKNSKWNLKGCMKYT